MPPRARIGAAEGIPVAAGLLPMDGSGAGGARSGAVQGIGVASAWAIAFCEESGPSTRRHERDRAGVGMPRSRVLADVKGLAMGRSNC
jgi:hypothetical protein